MLMFPESSQCDSGGMAGKCCVLAPTTGKVDSIGMRFPVLSCIFMVALWLLPAQAGAEPGARIRTPRADAKMDYEFTAKGRSSNIPEGQVVMLFRPIGESGFLFPLSEELKGNSSFSEKIYHQGTDQGLQVIQVRMVSAEVAGKAAKYRREILKWYAGGKKGPQPSLAPGLLEGTKRLAEVVYELDAG